MVAAFRLDAPDRIAAIISLQRWSAMIPRQPWLLNHRSGSPCMDDAAIVSGLKSGDALAVEYVVKQYAPALYRFAYYQLQDEATAEDVVAEVMSRMVRKVDSFVLEQASLQTWLFRIARNLIADHYKLRKRRPQVSLEALLDDEPGEEPGRYDPELEILLDRERLQTALAMLTDEQRQVILLHVIEGWELPQVSDLLGRTIPSVKSLYYRGVRSLRRALTESSEGGNYAPEKSDQ